MTILLNYFQISFQEPYSKNLSMIGIRKGKNMTNPCVKLYALSTCSHCKATKKFLGECKVKYDVVDVDLLGEEERTEIVEDIKQLNPRCSFPTIIIGDKVIVGYQEDLIKEALGL